MIQKWRYPKFSIYGPLPLSHQLSLENYPQTSFLFPTFPPLTGNVIYRWFLSDINHDHVFFVGLNISKRRKVGLAFHIPKSGTMWGYFLIFAEVGEQSSEQWAHSNYWSQFLPFPPPWPECLLRQERMICCPTAGRFAGTGGASYNIGRSGGKRGPMQSLEILNGLWFIFRI